MGAKSSEVATKIDFDTPIKESDFGLPKFIIYDEYGEKLDIDKLSTHTPSLSSKPTDVQP